MLISIRFLLSQYRQQCKKLPVNLGRFKFCQPLSNSETRTCFKVAILVHSSDYLLFKFFLKNQTKERYVKDFIASYAMQQVNPFLVNVPILYPLRTPEGYKMGTLTRSRLIFDFQIPRHSKKKNAVFVCLLNNMCDFLHKHLFLVCFSLVKYCV